LFHIKQEKRESCRFAISPVIHDLFSRLCNYANRHAWHSTNRRRRRRKTNGRWTSVEMVSGCMYVTRASGDECHYLHTFSDRVTCG